MILFGTVHDDAGEVEVNVACLFPTCFVDDDFFEEIPVRFVDDDFFVETAFFIGEEVVFFFCEDVFLVEVGSFLVEAVSFLVEEEVFLVEVVLINVVVFDDVLDVKPKDLLCCL